MSTILFVPILLMLVLCVFAMVRSIREGQVMRAFAILGAFLLFTLAVIYGMYYLMDLLFA